MKLIDRYIYAVTESLPEDMREDIGQELLANIEDMLPDNPTEEQVRMVLEEMGNPKHLANEYNPKRRYLIGPGLYDKYLTVLKMVVGICITVFMCLVLLTWILDLPDVNNVTDYFPQLLADLIVAAVQGIMQGAVWVTLVFVILERSGINEGQQPFQKRDWTTDDLPVIPVNEKGKISRRETLTSIFATMFVTALLYIQPQLIAVYHKGSEGVMNVIPVFSLDGLRLFMPYIIGLAIIQIGFYIWKYVTGSWNIPLAIGNAVINGLLCILMILMLTSQRLFRDEFISFIADIINGSAASVSAWWNRSLAVFAVVFIALCIWESVTAFQKCKN